MKIIYKIISIKFLLLGCILTFCISMTTVAQNITVSGTVTNAETGQSLPGVNVIVKGTTIGTATDTEGNYEINISSPQDTLIYSFIGFTTQTVPVNGRTEINVSLKPQIMTGQELVVVGFGTQKKRNISTSVATISSEEMGDAPVSQALQSLQGKLSGVSIRQTSGRPGSGIRIRIRGAASISTSSAPLYVIDGVPISGGIDFLSSNMIESISVLKGAAAASLYGSRASNGVVLVETKKTQGDETTLNFNSYVGIQQIPEVRNIDVMNAREFATFQKYIAEVNGRPVPEQVQNPAQYGEGTNWQREIQRTAVIQSYNLNIGIGSEDFSASIMGGYLNQQGVIIGTGYQRYSLRINSNYQPTDKLTIGLNLAPNYELNSTIYDANDRMDVIGLTRLVSPMVSPYNPDGSLKMVIDDGVSFAEPNPILIAKQREYKNRDLHLLANGYVSYELLEGLTLKTAGSIELNRNRVFHFSPTSNGDYGSLPPNIPSSSTSYSNFYNWRSASSLTYAKDIGKHSFDLLGVFVAQKERELGNGISATQYPMSNDIKTINVAGKISASNFYGAWTLLSYVGRLNYSYADKYLLQVSLRRDGSSRFGPKNRWGYFPSVSGGWIVSSEDFWNVEPISFLKIRASYGVTGNFEIGNYTYFQNIGTGFYTFGDGLAQARNVSNLADLGLGWENTKSYDIGLDISLFNNRISLTYDYYHKKTTDLLYSVSVPASSGFNSLQTNIGSIEFWGHELAISGQIVESADWSWNSNFNISFPNNKVLTLGTKNHILYDGWGGLLSGSNITKVGQPIGMLYGMVHTGVYRNEAELQEYATFDKSIVGSTRYKDTNGDGTLSEEDATILGNPRPDFYYGITNNISYKNFNLSFVIAGSYGGQVMAIYQQGLLNLDGVFNVLQSVKHQWRGPQNPGKAYWPGSKAGNTNLIRDFPNSTMIIDATHLNIENITLGYTLQLNSKPLNKVRMYVSMQNVLFFSYLRTNSSGASTHTGDTDLGLIRYPYPVPRTISFGVNISL